MSEKPVIASHAEPIILDDPAQGYNYSQIKTLRENLKIKLNSSQWQSLIIVLVICDALLVGTDIILSNVYCAEEHPPHRVEVTEEWLRILSIIILSFFVLEWLLEAWVHGFRRWVRTVLHAVDLVIVMISLALELLALLLDESALEVGGLLVVFRLWRVVRVMQAVKEVQHKRAHEEISSLKEANKQLFELQSAHHELIRGLHREFVQRFTALKSARLEHLCVNANAAKPELKDESPTLDDMLTSVSTQSHNLRSSVHLHRRSLHTHEAVNKGAPLQPGQTVYAEPGGKLTSVFTDSVGSQGLETRLPQVSETYMETASEGLRVSSSDGGSKA